MTVIVLLAVSFTHARTAFVVGLSQRWALLPTTTSGKDCVVERSAFLLCVQYKFGIKLRNSGCAEIDSNLFNPGSDIKSFYYIKFSFDLGDYEICWWTASL